MRCARTVVAPSRYDAVVDDPYVRSPVAAGAAWVQTSTARTARSPGRATLRSLSAQRPERKSSARQDAAIGDARRAADGHLAAYHDTRAERHVALDGEPLRLDQRRWTRGEARVE